MGAAASVPSTADGGHGTRTIPVGSEWGLAVERAPIGVALSPAFGVPGQNENVTSGRMR